MSDIPECLHRSLAGDGSLRCASPFVMASESASPAVCASCPYAGKTCADKPGHPACAPPVPEGRHGPCRWLGPQAMEGGRPVLRECHSCGRGGLPLKLKAFDCLHPSKHASHPLPTMADCRGCADREETTVHPESEIPAAAMAALIRSRPPGSWPLATATDPRDGRSRDEPAGSWRCWPNAQEAMRMLAEAKVNELTGLAAPPAEWGRWSGQGVVVAGGAAPVRRAGLPHGYLPSAWVQARRLRQSGCKLPVQLWHLGPNEMDLALSRLLRDELQVETVDALAHPEAARTRILAGWELKPFACLHSPFREILFLDADAASVHTPESMLAWPEYRAAGACFFPDFDHPNFMGRLKQGVWDIFGIAARDEPSFESGQFLVDKGRCWRELRMALWYAEHSDFTFGHVYGDKECFHLGWRKLGTDYAMPPSGPVWEGNCCIVQHAFDGTPAVLHRCQDKWRLDGGNRRVEGLVMEDELHAASADLRARWDGLLWHRMANRETAKLREALEGQRFLYARLPAGGFPGDTRAISFGPGGMVAEGAAGCEAFWTCQAWDGRAGIALHGAGGTTCALMLGQDGAWRGKWADHERCGVELRPLP